MPSRYAFPRYERLIRRNEFERVFQEGLRKQSRGFVWYGLRREGQGRKFGCTVSRKTGNAVQRNRIKRYLREIYRTHRPFLREDIHMVVVARSEANHMSFHECRSAVLELFRAGDALNG